MRFMMLVKANKDYEEGHPPKAELMAAVGKLADEHFRAGLLVETGGLLPSSRGARVRVAGGRVSVTDGPFTESKELIGGYAIFQLQSKDQAIELGRQFMALHGEILGPSYEGELEIRQLADFDSAHP